MGVSRTRRCVELTFDINQFKYRKVDDTDRYKDRWQPVSHEANLYKIHGSINWKTLSGGELYQVEDNSDAQSVVIYPTMLKHRETAQAPYSELFREFSNQYHYFTKFKKSGFYTNCFW